MSEFIEQFNEYVLVGPIWPATVLMALLMVYALIAAVGMADFDFEMDVDLDLDIDADVPDISADVPDFDGIEGTAESGSSLLGSLGAMTLRWSNFGRVPIAIWGGAFTIALWVISYTLWHSFDSTRYGATFLPSLLLTIRNSVVAVVIAKMVTQPMVGKFDKQPGYDSKRIVGSTAEISSIEATPSFGQAKFRTNAAPLLLNVRTNGPTIAKGTEVRVVDFNPTKRIYTVTNITSENQS